MSSYFRGAYATGTPTLMKGYLTMPGSRLLIGTSRLYGSLEHSSTAYNSYGGISIGLQAGQFVDAGLVGSLSFGYAPEVTPLESANVATPAVFTLSGETCTVSVGLQQLNPEIFGLAFLSGTSYSFQDEWLLSFGDACTDKYRPISIEFQNNACDAPISANIANGVTGGVLTLYDCYCSSGLTWEMNAGEISSIDLEFTAIPVLSNSRGNRLGSLWVY